MKKRETPSQTSVPCSLRDQAQQLGGIAGRTNAIGVNRLETPHREKIGTSTMPVPGEGGGAEFLHHTHPSAGKRRK